MSIGSWWRRSLALPATVLLAAAAMPATEALAQSRLEIVEPGPGRAGALLTEVTGRPYSLRLPAEGRLELPSDSSFDRSLIVVGGDLMLAGTVNGDVVVVGGDLFLRPGVRVAGRAIAIGGGVYPTDLGEVAGEKIAFRDVGFDILTGGAADVVQLVYRSSVVDYRQVVSLPGVHGVRLPGYDRVNGLSFGFGPRIGLADDRLTLDPVVTYRSDLGEVDPSLSAELALGQASALLGRAERGTFTNDAWSQPDAVNSAASLFLGSDSRNYWRATRVEALLRREFQHTDGPFTLAAGARWEDARSVGPEAGSRSGPWALRHADNSTDGMLRPNPPVLRGRLLSALLDGSVTLLRADVSGDAALRLEVPLDSPDDGRWLQTTLDAHLTLPTFGAQYLAVTAHAVATAGDAAPPQRWSYLGGGATIATLHRLEQGGDMLLYLDGAYVVPLPRPQLPIFGAPVVALRYAVGGAGVGSLPALVQNVGGGIGFSMVRLDFLVDPSSGRTSFGVAVTPFR